MNASTVTEQMERLALAGYFAPSGDKLTLMVTEWTQMLHHYDTAQLVAGVDWLMTHRTERWWPTVGEVLAAIRAATGPKPESTYRCATCAGTGWVEAVPFRSMGQLYEAMQRCPDCAIPVPSYSVARGSRHSLSPSEHRAWLLARPSAPVLTEEQFYARLRAMGADRMTRGWRREQNDASA